MLVIPNLHESPFHLIEVGLWVPRDQLSVSDRENHGPFEGVALKAHIPGERTVFATIEVCPGPGDTEELHAALSISRAESQRGPQLAHSLHPEGGQSSDKWKHADPDSIWEALDVFLDKQVNLFAEASFRFDRNLLPQQSLVSSMIGLRTVAGEDQFFLTGAQFAVRGYPDDTVSWYLTPGTSGKKVSGQIVRRCALEFDWESVSNVVWLLQARLNRLILPQSDVSVHA